MTNLAIYPGSFNPFHMGHKNILEKIEKVFDHVIIAIGENPDKENPGHIEEVKKTIPNNKVETFSGFLSDYVKIKEEDGFNVTIVRGLRNSADLDYEVNQMRFIQDQNPNVKFVFIVCDKEYDHISSCAIRSLEKIKKGSSIIYTTIKN